ncbi:hypothetical protein ABPG75_011936 [Micractinium tetrahymenae]
MVPLTGATAPNGKASPLSGAPPRSHGRQLRWRLRMPPSTASLLLAAAICLWTASLHGHPPPLAADACPPCTCRQAASSREGKADPSPGMSSSAAAVHASGLQCSCTAGGVPCAHTEYARSRLLVLAAHGENTSWAFNAGVKVPIKVYTNSNDSSVRIAAGVLSGRGKEARSYIAAILEHWDRLPDAVAFMHAHGDSWHNYLGEVHTNSEWRLMHLRWPTNEDYVDLTCREPGLMIGVFSTDGKNPASARDPRGATLTTAWQEFFRHHLGLHPPSLKHPREFYEDTIRWLDETSLEAPELTMEYLWQVMFSRRHRGTYAWAFLQSTCMCYLYGLACEKPDTLFHLNPSEPATLPW